MKKVYYPTERQLSALRLRATPMAFKEVAGRLGVVPERAQQMTWTAVRRLQGIPDRESHPDWPLVAVCKALVHVKAAK